MLSWTTLLLIDLIATAEIHGHIEPKSLFFFNFLPSAIQNTILFDFPSMVCHQKRLTEPKCI